MSKRTDEVAGEFIDSLNAGPDIPADECAAGTAKKSPPDPSVVAARLMLLRCVTGTRLRKRVRTPGIAVVVDVPGAAWVEPIAKQWKIQFPVGADPVDKYDPGFKGHPPWIEFARDGSCKYHRPDKGNDSVVSARWDGSSVLGLSHAPTVHLPTDLIRIADFRFSIPSMDASMLSTVISSVSGRAPSDPIPADLPSKMTPAILKLGWRRKLSANGYLARLVALVRPPETGRPGPSLDDLHGMNEATDWGRAIVRDFKDYRAGLIAWSEMSRGLLLWGKPGTGKTLFAEALSRSSGLQLVSSSFAEWQSAADGHLGDCLKSMRATFAAARAAAPCILFIDELDALGDRKGSDDKHRTYWVSVITCFLEQLDGIGGREGVLVLGATNHPEFLDRAIVRAGRMDRLIEIQLPDHGALAKILRHHLGPDLAGVDLLPVARRMLGATGADCAKSVRCARQRARHEERPVELADVLAETGAADGNPMDDRRTAVHEAGHAVVMSVLRPGELAAASIGNVSGGGRVEALFSVRTTRQAFHHEILGLLAGRAAEELLLDEVSGGCGGPPGSDLALATCLAVALEGSLGLGGSGLLWLGMPTPDNVGTMLALRPALAAKVGSHLEDVYREAVDLIRRHRAAVSAVADALIVNRSLGGSEIAALVAATPPSVIAGDSR